jgi:hypothetical protein
MSKKNRKRERNKSVWKYLVMGFTGLALLAWVVTSFRSTGATQAAVSGGTPSVLVDKKLIDFGNLKDYTNETFSFLVTNTGTGMLSFIEKPYVEVLEGCCPPELSIGKMNLRPGESTRITSTVFFMHPGMDGRHNFGVHLKTNDPAQPDLVVNLLSNWSQ